MKRVNIVVLLAGLGFSAGGTPVEAGGAGDQRSSPTSVPSVMLGADTNASSQVSGGHILLPPGTGRLLYQPDRAPGPGWPAMTSDVQALVTQFQNDRAKFIAQRNQLLDQMNNATADRRAGIRSQLGDLRDQWQDEQLQLRAEMRDQLQDLRERLRNSRIEQLRDADSPGDGRHNKH